jgi:hypothetical protein
MLIVIQILFLLLNIATAIYQARLFDKGKKISHFWWAVAYCAAVAGIWFWMHNWLLCVALIVQRMPVFNTSLNLARHNGLFYLGTGSALDKVMTKYNLYPIIFFLSIGGLITIQVFL